MVNVTKDNFIEQSNDLLRHLPTAAFVAIDEEMTGISLPGRSWRQPKDETPSQRYKADLKQVPERYSIIQFGVCLFHSTAVDTISTSSSDARAGDEHVEWKVRRYNFWMFPNEKSSREIVMSPSAVKFLNDNGMNFDQWTKKGVHFVSCNEACATLKKFVEKTRQAQDLQQAQDNSRQPPETLDQASRPRVDLRRPEDIDFFSRTMAHLREWLDAAIPQHARHGHAAPPHLAATWEGSSTLLPECNAFLRRALYESIEQEYPSLVLESARSEGYPNRIRVFRLNEEEKARRRIRLRRLSWNELIEKKIGMTRIFCALARVASGLPLDRHSILFAPSIDHVGCWNEEHIASASFVPGILEDEDATLDDDDASQYHHHCEAAAAAAASNASTGAGRKVPIIVHNGFMDLCFLLTHFVNPTLPDHLVDVKSMIRKCFPIVYDTKILATETAAVDGPGGGGGMGANNTRLGSLFERYANLRRAGDAYRPLVDREIRIQPPYRAAAAEAGGGGGPDNVNDNADYNYDRDDDDDIDQEHAASYDAYMTGFVFTGLIRDVQAVHRLPLRPERDEEERRANGGDDGDSRSEHSVHGSDDSEDGEEEEGELTLGQVESNLQRLVSFISQDETSTESCDHDLRVLFGRNRLFQMSMYTMDLEEPSMRDPLSRGMRGESAFRISGFDPNISTRDIVRCLAGLVDRRGRRVNFEILWINDTTFIVAACWRPAPPAMVAANAAAVARGQARAAAAAALNAAVARVVANRNNDNDNGGAPGAAVIEFAAAQVAADRNNRVPAAAVAAAAVAAAAGARIAADRNNNNNGNGGPEAVRAAVAGALNDAIAAAGANQNDNGGAAGGVDVAAAADRIADGAAAAAAALNAAADAGAAAAANQNDDDENEEEEEEEDSTTIIREHGQLIRDALATRFSSETITNLNDYMDSLEEAEAAAVVAAAGLSEKDSSAASSWASRIWSMLGFGDKKRAAEQNDGEEESRANKRRRLNP